MLDPQAVSPEEIVSREVELDFICFRLLLNSSATDIVFVTLCTAVETAIT